ncbi:putative AH domain-containing protein [Lupinus albus]|uniref:Putative AH domain-containing protein n=1 Tax=Lupinus albus TaxID=3870 RepID=A0A6A4NQJ0_LUPAL|nr:putative AH domain-containing protein [Lupinus albus]
MKSSLNKLKRIALPKSVVKDKKKFQQSTKFDELALAAKDMQEMRDCYDSLLAAAAATENSAYEFAESLGEMGNCLLEKTTLNEDEESGKILGILGNVQLELQKLVDIYRSHIIQTITNPSESLLNEIRTVEDMKRQCDEKRDVYEYMIGQHKEKGRSKSGKGESITSQQLQGAHDAYEEEATLCVFRLKSLKQGQSRSFLTQAARHYAAQLNFFRKGLKSLEAVEPHVRVVAEQQHIDYQFSSLEEDDVKDGYDDDDDDEKDYETNEGGELSFDYRSNKQGPDIVSTSPNSTEISFDMNQGDFKVLSHYPRVSSYSAPIIAEKRFDPAERVKQLLSSSTAKSNAYVLPTPVSINEIKNSSAPRTSASGHSHNLWHSSPLDEKKNEKDFVDGRVSAPTIPRSNSVLKESNSERTSTQLPRPSAEGLSLPQVDIFNAYDTDKIKRHAFSGPLTTKPLSVKPSSSGVSIGSTDLPPLVSGVFPRLRMSQPLSPKVSPAASPPLDSSPRISELHELPRPPGNQSAKPVNSSRTGHSAPLVFRNPEHPSNKFPSVVLSAASPLPAPPVIVSRSFSIPPSSQRATALSVTKYLDTPRVLEKVKEAASPPLAPKSQRASSKLDLASHSSEIQGEILFIIVCIFGI